MYIRTKDGVYEELDTTEQGVWTIYGKFIENNEILKQSEDLEELCDEIVIDNWKERGKPVYCFKYVKKTKTAYCIDGGGYITLFIPKILECGCIIKGAIWTEWGLKYVAKMDNEGKLVLI